VASYVGRTVEYFSFHDEKFIESVGNILKLISDKKVCIGQLYRYLKEYCQIMNDQSVDIDLAENQFDQFLNEFLFVPEVSLVNPQYMDYMLNIILNTLILFKRMKGNFHISESLNTLTVILLGDLPILNVKL
jgi:hypothetical protein